MARNGSRQLPAEAGNFAKVPVIGLVGVVLVMAVSGIGIWMVVRAEAQQALRQD